MEGLVGCSSPLGIKRCFGAALAALICCSSAQSETRQPPERWTALADPVFQSFVQEQGLAASLYNAIAEDGEGFLWVGGGKALFRWDGYHFRGYQADPGNPRALQDSYVLCMHRDPQGRLWIGTSAGGIARYDRETDSFITIGAGPNGLTNSSVAAIADDGEGGLWIGTEGGLDHLAKDGGISHWHHRDDEQSSLPDDRVTRLLRDKAGRLWVGTRGGLARLDPGQNGLLRVSLPPPGNPRPTIWALAGDEARARLGRNPGAGRLCVRAGSPVYHACRGGAPEWRDESIGALVEGTPGEMWIGTYGQGIVTYDAATGASHRLRHDPTRQSSLADDQVHALYRDRAGMVWAGVTGTVRPRRSDPGCVADPVRRHGASGRPVRQRDLVDPAHAGWQGLGRPAQSRH